MLGFMGATRRLDHYEAATGWHPLFLTVAFGALIILGGVMIQMYGLFKSIKDRNKNRDKTGDPWNARTLEWATTSPPPIYNFAITPVVDQIDPLWAMKRGNAPPQGDYEDIHLPRNTPMGMYIGLLSLIFGFAFTWHIWWLVIASFIAIIICLIIRLSGKDEHDLITVAQVKEMEAAHLRKVGAV
jgi:cytochrome o ubiquinol oxidase subunit 1